jgi:regulator of protease activity HflC (stomatin/prohibitin superfamily)
MKKTIFKMKHLFLILLAANFAVTTTSCNRIDAGHVGIKVNLYGSNKGVQDVVNVTGMVFYNPITTSVYEFPTFVQTKDYEPFVITAKDASEFVIDPKLNYFVKADSVPKIFKTYRKPLRELEDGFIRNVLYDAYRISANSFSSDSLMSNRATFEEMVQKHLEKELQKEGFIYQQLTSAITPPKSLRESIDAKNKAVQDALALENKVKQAEAKAKSDVAKAEGDARALKITADAEAYYNIKVSSSLTQQLLTNNFVTKWDGKLPVYGTTPQLFKDVTK